MKENPNFDQTHAKELDIQPLPVTDSISNINADLENQAFLNEQVDERSNENCGHHWDIASPDGPTSLGVCKKCGAMREFSNSQPASSFGSIWEPKTTKKRKKEAEVDIDYSLFEEIDNPRLFSNWD